MNLRTDNRAALSFHIIVLISSLIIGALLYILLEPMVETLMTTAGENTQTEAAAQGQSYVTMAFANAHFIIIGLGVLQLLAAAVFEAEVRP